MCLLEIAVGSNHLRGTRPSPCEMQHLQRDIPGDLSYGGITIGNLEHYPTDDAGIHHSPVGGIAKQSRCQEGAMATPNFEEVHVDVEPEEAATLETEKSLWEKWMPSWRERNPVFLCILFAFVRATWPPQLDAPRSDPVPRGCGGYLGRRSKTAGRRGREPPRRRRRRRGRLRDCCSDENRSSVGMSSPSHRRNNFNRGSRAFCPCFPGALACSASPR